MLMADMTESERETVRDLHRHGIPEGTEMVEFLPVLWHGLRDIALIRMPDGSHGLTVLEGMWMPDDVSTIEVLEDRLAVYDQAINETRRFLGIARAALGQTDPDNGWACPSCGIQFGDPQPVCPDCGAEHE